MGTQRGGKTSQHPTGDTYTIVHHFFACLSPSLPAYQPASQPFPLRQPDTQMPFPEFPGEDKANQHQHIPASATCPPPSQSLSPFPFPFIHAGTHLPQ
ncbi:hypothetical protein O3P69_015922 [Scylla paramamosain]|uniref:Uncharacterized protein n=1 Tax=Scylla paramamosain TaxID=85552 RepID=A0AAW0T8K1_SCYPA